MACLECGNHCEHTHPVWEAVGKTTIASDRLAGYLCDDCWAELETEGSLALRDRV